MSEADFKEWLRNPDGRMEEDIIQNVYWKIQKLSKDYVDLYHYIKEWE